jgi:hypothetical protein
MWDPRPRKKKVLFSTGDFLQNDVEGCLSLETDEEMKDFWQFFKGTLAKLPGFLWVSHP